MMDLLADLTVVEIADDAGAYVGKLLGDFGADVVRVEPRPAPAGWWSMDPDEAVGRFLHHPKRRVSLGVDDPAGRSRLAALLAGADVVVESGQPNALEAWGATAEQVLPDRPDLVWVRITPFGVDGPRAGQAGSDLVCAALGGFLNLAGYPDAAPTRAYGDQSLRMAGLHAAVGAALALLDRAGTGRGQLVDVAIQESVATALENALQFFDLEGVVRNRTGQGYREAGTGVFACRDGLVYLMAGRLSTKIGWQRLTAWMVEAEVAGAEQLLRPEWSDTAYRATPAAEQTFREIFEDFASRWAASDLYRECQERSIVLCPVSTPEQLLGSEHLRARGFFAGDDTGPFVGPPFRITPSLRPVEASVAADLGRAR
jgi:benzylsuccinate CoA-transferase BbsE subunit